MQLYKITQKGLCKLHPVYHNGNTNSQSYSDFPSFTGSTCACLCVQFNVTMCKYVYQLSQAIYRIAQSPHLSLMLPFDDTLFPNLHDKYGSTFPDFTSHPPPHPPPHSFTNRQFRQKIGHCVIFNSFYLNYLFAIALQLVSLILTFYSSLIHIAEVMVPNTNPIQSTLS